VPKTVDEERYSMLCDLWSPSENYTFTFVAQGYKKLSFKSDWIKEFPWLSYSTNFGGGFYRALPFPSYYL
jgi:hypothetical protein